MAKFVKSKMTGVRNLSRDDMEKYANDEIWKTIGRLQARTSAINDVQCLQLLSKIVQRVLVQTIKRESIFADDEQREMFRGAFEVALFNGMDFRDEAEKSATDRASVLSDQDILSIIGDQDITRWVNENYRGDVNKIAEDFDWSVCQEIVKGETGA